MDPKLYKAISTGQLKYFHNRNKRLWDEFAEMKSHKGNTILHIAVEYGRGKLIAEKIIKKCKKSLVFEQNLNGDTPLHFAVRRPSNIRIVRLLVDWLKGENGEEEERKKLVRMVNRKGETALHEAVRSKNLKAVELLMGEDEELASLNNNEGESPLFIAVDKSFYRIARHILKAAPRCCSFGGRGGMNVLHAAIIRSKPNFMEEVIGRYYPAISEADHKFGWIPLHYAAYMGNLQVVALLLRLGASESLLKMEDNEGMSALHIAAKNNQIFVVKALIKSYPFMKESVDSKSRTALHVAAEAGMDGVVRYFSGRAFYDLVNEGDINGNTPLHLAAIEEHKRVCNILISHSRVDLRAVNKDGLTAIDIVKSKNITISNMLSRYDEILEHFVTSKNIKQDQGSENPQQIHNEAEGHTDEPARKSKDAPKALMELANINLIIVTIVATVTFTAALAVPGGYNSTGDDHAGTAVLTKRAAFQAFVVSNSLAFGFSTALMTLRLWIAFTKKDEDAENILKWSFMFRNFAVLAMVVAFLSGEYVVLSNSHGLAVTAVTVACLAFFAPAFTTRFANLYDP